MGFRRNPSILDTLSVNTLTVNNTLNFGDVSTDVFTIAGKIQGSLSGAKYVSIGTPGTSHTLAAVNDLYVAGILEVDGVVYFDGGLSVSTALDILTTVSFSGGIYGGFARGSDDGLYLCTGTTGAGNNNLIVTMFSNRTKDHDHTPVSTNPRLWIHSATDPDSDNTQYVVLYHNQTDGVVDCGKGTLNLGPTGNVNFAGATRTASTVTHDAYVTLEVAGTAYKFMLGS